MWVRPPPPRETGMTLKYIEFNYNLCLSNTQIMSSLLKSASVRNIQAEPRQWLPQFPAT